MKVGLQIISSSPGRDAKYCDACVCLSVCPLAYLRNHTAKLHQTLRRCRSFYEVAIHYALPVLWMTSWAYGHNGDYGASCVFPSYKRIV